MKRSGKRALGVSLLAMALAAAACGGSKDSGGGNTSGANLDKGVQDAISSTTAAGGNAVTTTAVAAQPTSMDDWEKRWEQERAAIVKRAKDEKWGKSADGKTLTGPSGFTVDLTKCASGWSDTEGITDTSIKIGQTIAQSGTFAEYNNYSKAITSIFDYYGAKGMFKDSTGKTRTVNYITKDDGYDPAKTIPAVDELLDSEKVFAIWTLGSPSTLKVYDKINQRCVPHPLAMTGHAAWGDPVNHPWTTGAPAIAYSTEAVLWGSFIEKHLSEFPADRKVRVAALVMNNDFGKLYAQTFKAYIAQSATLKDRVELSTDNIEASAPTITDNMTTLKSKNPDIFIGMIAATACTQAVTEAAQNGMKDSTKYMFQPETCSGTAFVKKEKVGGDGAASNGWWIVNPAGKDLTDPAWQGDAWVKFARELLNSHGYNPDQSSLFGSGLAYGWPMTQALIVAGQLDGGLTRTNLILALRSLDMTNPTLVPGAKFKIDGNKDSYYIEAAQFAQWDSAKQSWVPQGDVIDLNGKSSNCSWDQAAGACK